MTKERVIPLIVATALFMENMDSTVIATSLPAIASDIGTSPLTLKLAITSYLLSLAVFIPASGWTADRFGARKVFSAAIAVFMIGSIGCAISSSINDFVIARVVQGLGGTMMTPVGRLVLLRSFDGLMDRALSEDEVTRIRAAIEVSLDEGMTYHALRTRRAGALRFADYHLLVPGHLSVQEAHDCEMKIEAAIAAAVPEIEVTSHIEPVEEPLAWNDTRWHEGLPETSRSKR